MIVAVTGHRPPRLGLSYSPADRARLEAFARNSLVELMELRGMRCERLVSGLAQGWDQACAYAALSLKVPVTAAVPFVGQEGRWPADEQRRYQELLTRCDVKVVCPGEPKNWKYARRDEWMVENCGVVLALFDGEPTGGTWLTVRHAARLGRLVHNVWGSW